MGSRYGGLKQIDPVGPLGEIVLDYSVYDAIQAGFGKVVFVIRPDIEKTFRKIIGRKLEGKLNVEYVFQTLENLPKGFVVPKNRIKPWGTGQAVLSARSVINEPFAVINADDFYGRESFAVLAKKLIVIDKFDCCMVGFYIKNTLSPHGGVVRGFCDVQQKKLSTIVERLHIERKEDGVIRYEENGTLKEMADNEIVSMNLWGFTTQLFDSLDHGFTEFLKNNGGETKSEYLLPEQIDRMIKNGEISVTVLSTNEKWMGVTYSKDKLEVMAGIRTLLNSGIYPDNLWA